MKGGCKKTAPVVSRMPKGASKYRKGPQKPTATTEEKSEMKPSNGFGGHKHYRGIDMDVNSTSEIVIIQMVETRNHQRFRIFLTPLVEDGDGDILECVLNGAKLDGVDLTCALDRNGIDAALAHNDRKAAMGRLVGSLISASTIAEYLCKKSTTDRLENMVDRLYHMSRDPNFS